MKVSVVNLGCKVNQSEGEDLLNGFAAAGFEVAGRDEAADIIVVNTCTVTNEADRKSRKAIHRACGVASLVVVTGCYAAVAAEELRKIEGVSIVISQADKGKLVEEILVRHEARGMRQESVDGGKADSRLITHASRLNTKVRGFLKVQDGCDNRCAYCIVPDARGNPVSAPVAEILAKAGQLVAGGASEIILTGINIGKFRICHSERSEESDQIPRRDAPRDDIRESAPRNDIYDSDLVGLVHELLQVPGVLRVRISSIEPEDVTLDLINLMVRHEARGMRQESADGGKADSRLITHASRLNTPYLCPHLHIPLQSGDRRVLQRMGRRYIPSDYLRLCNSIRHACPDVAITTDVIVGFPGETDQEFANTMMLLEQAKPSRIHVFKYSKRAGTPAADMPDQVADEIKAKRSEAVRELGERLADEYRASFAGKELDVLVEREKDGMLVGTTENYLAVSIPGSKADIGKIIRHKTVSA